MPDPRDVFPNEATGLSPSPNPPRSEYDRWRDHVHAPAADTIDLIADRLDVLSKMLRELGDLLRRDGR